LKRLLLCCRCFSNCQNYPETCNYDWKHENPCKLCITF